MTSSYHLVNSSCCTFVVNRLREMLFSSFPSFSQEDHSKLRSTKRSCFLEDSEASFVPCEKDVEPLATQWSSARIKDGPWRSVEFERWSTALCSAMISFITYKTESFGNNRWSQVNDELELYINPKLAISYRLCVLRNIFWQCRSKYEDNYLASRWEKQKLFLLQLLSSAQTDQN